MVSSPFIEGGVWRAALCTSIDCSRAIVVSNVPVKAEVGYRITALVACTQSDLNTRLALQLEIDECSKCSGTIML